MGSIQASSDTVESEGRQMKHCWITYIKKYKKSRKSPFNIQDRAFLGSLYNIESQLEENLPPELYPIMIVGFDGTGTEGPDRGVHKLLSR